MKTLENCENQSASTDRQVEEREMCVLFEFRHFFFNSENSSTYFQSFVTDVLELQTAFAQMESREKAFWFSEGRTKVYRFIGSPRLNKWTFTTCM